jgi:hypothetical protein
VQTVLVSGPFPGCFLLSSSERVLHFSPCQWVHLMGCVHQLMFRTGTTVPLTLGKGMERASVSAVSAGTIGNSAALIATVI